MNAFWTLLGQIFSIVIIQSILDMLIDSGKRPYLSSILAIACYVISLYLLVQFVFDNIINEIYEFFSRAFL